MLEEVLAKLAKPYLWSCRIGEPSKKTNLFCGDVQGRGGYTLVG